MVLGKRLVLLNDSNKHQLTFNLQGDFCLLESWWIVFEKAMTCYSFNFFFPDTILCYSNQKVTQASVMQTTNTIKEEWNIYSLFVDCLAKKTDVSGKKQLSCHKKWTQNMCRKQIISKSISRDHLVQSEQSQPINGHIHSMKKAKQNS